MLRSACLFFLLVALSGVTAAQPLPASAPAVTEPTGYGTGFGASLLLTNYGFGLGGLYRGTLGASTSLVVEASMGSGKDEREQEFFVGFFGDTVVPFKRSYFLMAPVHVGIERRLFSEAVEDSFRPFVQVLAGPSLGYQWPYFDDEDGDGIRETGEQTLGALAGLGSGSFRFGAGATLAIGAYFGESRHTTTGIRIGYLGQYFFKPVDLLEPRVEVESPTQRFFGTPVVSLHLLRLF
jgi:hypothetical protein